MTLRDARSAERRGVALFADATLSNAFVARWCVGSKVETTGGVFRVREDGPALRLQTDSTAYRDSMAVAL